MKKADLTELTRLGVRAKLEQLQQYVRELHSEFPEEFATPTPPVFLKAQEKPGGNSWPAFIASSNGDSDETTSNKLKGLWTPERRAEQAQRVRARMAKAKWGTHHWHHVHDYLLKKAPHRRATVVVIANALKIKQSAARSAMDAQPKVFRHLPYSADWLLIKPVTTKTAKATTKGTANARPASNSSGAANKPWGTFHWQKIYDYLHEQDNRTARLADIMKAANIPTQASAITGMMGYKNLFKRTAPGIYQLIGEVEQQPTHDEPAE